MVQSLVALGALPAGASMIFHPEGGGLGLPLGLLEGTPFDSYLIPGILLFLINGLLPAYGAFVSFRNKPNLGRVGMALGLLLICWILIQVTMIGQVHSLHVLYLFIGVLETRLGYLLVPKEGSG